MTQTKTPVVIKSYDVIDVCGEDFDLECTISVGIGVVKTSDSLFGFNFELSSNRQKLYFNSGLTTNTLSQYFEFIDFHFYDDGTIRGDAANLSNRVVASPENQNMPLMAFKGKYLGTCPDTTYIRLKYIEFTDEFKKQIDTTDIYVLIEAKADKANKTFTTFFDKDTLKEFQSDSTISFDLFAQTNTKKVIGDVELEITNSNTQAFMISEVIADSGKAKIDSIRQIPDGYKVKLTIMDTMTTEKMLTLKIKELIRNDSKDSVKIKTLNLGNCACIKTIKDGKAFIQGRKDSVNSAIDNEANNRSIRTIFSNGNDRFIIQSAKPIKEINVYDMLGNLLESKEFIEDRNQIEILNYKYINGVYLASLKYNNGEINNIVLIKN